MITKCPHCKCDLKELGIYQLEDVQTKYYLDWIKKKGYAYGLVMREHLKEDEATFHCAMCDGLLDLGDEPFII